MQLQKQKEKIWLLKIIFWGIIFSQADDLISKKNNLLYCLELLESLRLTIIVVALLMPISLITLWQSIKK
jgi:hypothetical protein